MQLFDLEHLEVLLEPITDSKCLVAWGPKTVVLAFRGTASLTNVRFDLQVRPVVH